MPSNVLEAKTVQQRDVSFQNSGPAQFMTHQPFLAAPVGPVQPCPCCTAYRCLQKQEDAHTPNTTQYTAEPFHFFSEEVLTVCSFLIFLVQNDKEYFIMTFTLLFNFKNGGTRYKFELNFLTNMIVLSLETHLSLKRIKHCFN